MNKTIGALRIFAWGGNGWNGGHDSVRSLLNPHDGLA